MTLILWYSYVFFLVLIPYTWSSLFQIYDDYCMSLVHIEKKLYCYTINDCGFETVRLDSIIGEGATTTGFGEFTAGDRRGMEVCSGILRQRQSPKASTRRCKTSAFGWIFRFFGHGCRIVSRVVVAFGYKWRLMNADQMHSSKSFSFSCQLSNISLKYFDKHSFKF